MFIELNENEIANAVIDYVVKVWNIDREQLQDPDFRFSGYNGEGSLEGRVGFKSHIKES